MGFPEGESTQQCPLFRCRSYSPRFNSSPLKNGGWKNTPFLIGKVTFQGQTVKLREGCFNWPRDLSTLHSLKLTSAPENMQTPQKESYLPVPSIFMCKLAVSFREGL